MGVNLKDVIDSEPLDFSDLSGKTIAVDALNSLYQFLASIRQADGTPLMDANGNITSHLSGLFYRTTRLLKMGIKPVYVFDGEPDPLKKETLEKRKAHKERARREWDKAKAEGRVEDARKYAARTSRMTPEMIEESKTLLESMGVPFIQAPGEGEAQCALLARNGDAWACGSQDYDSLLFGAPVLVKGLTLSGQLELQIIRLKKALDALGITREQLVELALLVGTDFNEGVKGVGPKKGLSAVREGKAGELGLPDLEGLKSIFLEPNVSTDYEIKWSSVDVEGLVEFLSGAHSFSEERVRRQAKELTQAYAQFTQQSLFKWF